MLSTLRGAIIATALAAVPASPALAQDQASTRVEQVRLEVGRKAELHIPSLDRNLTIALRSTMTLTGDEYRSSYCDIVLSAGSNTESELSVSFLKQWRDDAKEFPVTATCGKDGEDIVLLVDARGSGAVRATKHMADGATSSGTAIR